MKRTVTIKPGDTYGRLTIIEEVEMTPTRVRRFRCKCECGNEVIVRMCHLRTKKHPTVSCGCYNKEMLRNIGFKHGFASDKQPYERLYKIWGQMKQRCTNPKDDHFRLYGARGITVCDEWLHDYMAFRTWAIDNNYNDSLTLDRINVDGNYEPSNCRWATLVEQQNNRRCNVRLSYNGETHTYAEWGRILNLNPETIRHRHLKGLPIEQVLYEGNLRHC